MNVNYDSEFHERFFVVSSYEGNDGIHKEKGYAHGHSMSFSGSLYCGKEEQGPTTGIPMTMKSVRNGRSLTQINSPITLEASSPYFCRIRTVSLHELEQLNVTLTI